MVGAFLGCPFIRCPLGRSLLLLRLGARASISSRKALRRAVWPMVGRSSTSRVLMWHRRHRCHHHCVGHPHSSRIIATGPPRPSRSHPSSGLCVIRRPRSHARTLAPVRPLISPPTFCTAIRCFPCVPPSSLLQPHVLQSGRWNRLHVEVAETLQHVFMDSPEMDDGSRELIPCAHYPREWRRTAPSSPPSSAIRKYGVHSMPTTMASDIQKGPANSDETPGGSGTGGGSSGSGNGASSGDIGGKSEKTTTTTTTSTNTSTPRRTGVAHPTTAAPTTSATTGNALDVPPPPQQRVVKSPRKRAKSRTPDVSKAKQKKLDEAAKSAEARQGKLLNAHCATATIR